MTGPRAGYSFVDFYATQTPTLRALGRKGALHFVLGHIRQADDEHTIRHAPLPMHPAGDDIAALRGIQDRAAVFRRYVWPGYAACAARFNTPLEWQRELEQIRCEAHAGSYLLGVRRNLRAYYSHQANTLISASADDFHLWAAAIRAQCLGWQKTGMTVDNAIIKDIKKISQLIELPDTYHYYSADFFYRHVQPLMDARVSRLNADDHAEQAGADLLESRRSGRMKEEIPDQSGEPEPLDPAEGADHGYRVYDTAFDEQCQAGDLAGADEQKTLRVQLDRAIREAGPHLARLAGRLLNTLYASESLNWQYEHEEGEVDYARLDRVIADPAYRYGYRQAQRRDQINTTLTLLVDNSGSMRGRPITVAAICADMLAQTLERFGVTVEILGYTTTEWNGGMVRQCWLEQRKPEHPGRLNALRHIVYKPAHQPWRRARNNLAVMLKDEVLKENIDGEALQWAWTRLMKRPQARKLLVVLSDGAPSDEATGRVNTSRLLGDHLHEVIRAIEQEGAVELLAIGIGYDVTAYYRNAVSIPTEALLGEVLIGQLCRIFTQGKSAWIGIRRGNLSGHGRANTGYAAMM